jgi:UDP-GlcNAc:undecaprenyl-phosphate GlcNAc-1-phosphate transferase
MPNLILLLTTSFALGFVLVPIARHLARRGGLVDRPDGRRKIHDRQVPRAGGLAVFAASAGALALAALCSDTVRQVLANDDFHLAGLFLASLVLCAVGVADDYGCLRGRHKLGGQVVAVGIVMSSGVVIEKIHFLGYPIELGLLALPFTGFWLLGAINALNLIDGMDGLLGCVGTIICVALAIMALLTGHLVGALVALSVAGALLAFLCYNFPPASIFMGDSGSMFVGLVVGTLAITSSLKGPATVALLGPAAILIIPIFDTLAAITRRKLTGRSIYTTDRGHIHHCLLRAGLSVRRVLLVVSALCLIAAGGAIASVTLQHEMLGVIAALTVVLILIAGRLFGHAEASLVKQRLLGAWSNLRGRAVCELEVRLQGSTEWTELWQKLVARALPMDLQAIRLDVNFPALHEGYHARWDRRASEGEVPLAWRAEVPLMVRGQAAGRLEVLGSRGEGIGQQLASVALLVAEAEAAVEALICATVEQPKSVGTDRPSGRSRTKIILPGPVAQ